jgi:hypothetical protein
MSFLRKYATGGRVYIKQAAAGHKKGWGEAKRGIQSAARPFKCWPENKNVARKLGEREVNRSRAGETRNFFDLMDNYFFRF